MSLHFDESGTFERSFHDLPGLFLSEKDGARAVIFDVSSHRRGTNIKGQGKNDRIIETFIFFVSQRSISPFSATIKL